MILLDNVMHENFAKGAIKMEEGDGRHFLLAGWYDTAHNLQLPVPK